MRSGQLISRLGTGEQIVWDESIHKTRQSGATRPQRASTVTHSASSQVLQLRQGVIGDSGTDAGEFGNATREMLHFGTARGVWGMLLVHEGHARVLAVCGRSNRRRVACYSRGGLGLNHDHRFWVRLCA